MLADARFDKTLQDITNVPVPVATRTYVPIAHRDLADQAIEAFQGVGRGIREQGFYLRDGGQKMMGIIQLELSGPPKTGMAVLDDRNYPLTILLRNSYDRSTSVGVASGPSAWWCTNMCISGSDMTFTHKHMGRVLEILAAKIQEAAATAESRYGDRLKEIKRLSSHEITDNQGYEILGRMYGNGILPSRMFTASVEDWKRPKIEAFADRNMWSLYNAVTGSVKRRTSAHIVRKNPIIHQFFLKEIATD